MWGRFFDSIGAPDDTESAISGSNIPLDPNTPSRFANSPLPGVVGSPHSEVHPNDSASVVDEERASELDGFPPLRGADAPGASSIGGAALSQAAVVPVDDGTYVFKFRTPGGRTHRFQARNDNVENLRDIVAGKLETDPFFTEWKPVVEEAPRPDPLDFHLQYTDADGDTVVISSDTDVSDAVKIARDARADRVVLLIQGGKGWDEAGASQGEAKAKEAAEAAVKAVKEVEKTEAALPEGVAFAPPAKVHNPPTPADDILGVPRDLLLPASIGALAVVIIGIFTISRLTQD
jgi:hypothetical protein